MKKELIKTATIIGLIILIFLLIGYISITLNYSQERNNLLKTILKAEIEVSEIYSISQKAESYYLEASYAYEVEDFKAVESNCRLARDYYSEESQGYKRVKAELKAEELDYKLITIYIESLDLLSEISLNMFEACEHFEVASRYYDTYYNTDVPYDDRSHEMGANEMDMMNEKIELHDKNVREYNDKLEEHKVELINLIG